MCNININILNKMRDVNKKYKGKYTYVQSFSDIHSGLDITRLSLDIQSLLNQYPFRHFAIFVRILVWVFWVGFEYGFQYRVKYPPLLYIINKKEHNLIKLIVLLNLGVVLYLHVHISRLIFYIFVNKYYLISSYSKNLF